MCGFGFVAYDFDCCHRSIDFSLMPSIGKPETEIKVKCKVLKKEELKRQNKQFVMRLRARKQASELACFQKFQLLS
ncbi:LOW QUALITY PROTEIN: uncharacterized protein LOC111079838 [Drosophila obscura]|uniref:LOW QUALITY PROTEIN: uncharacterized protein LOC111079838 n=1 Tax=Drosophila obscura TaxID=7282 RepID=UPI001BB24469|nr:LOW QUALITY PROTEIN: uncharacterized protein LOC111079838 [Drosophila obscura]